MSPLKEMSKIYKCNKCCEGGFPEQNQQLTLFTEECLLIRFQFLISNDMKKSPKFTKQDFFNHFQTRNETNHHISADIWIIQLSKRQKSENLLSLSLRSFTKRSGVTRFSYLFSGSTELFISILIRITSEL